MKKKFVIHKKTNKVVQLNSRKKKVQHDDEDQVEKPLEKMKNKIIKDLHEMDNMIINHFKKKS